MDPRVGKLTSKIVEVDKQAQELAKIGENSFEARQKRRELLFYSRQLANALQNEGQIVEGYLHGLLCHAMLARLPKGCWVIDVVLLKIAVDLGIFQALVDSETPLSLDDLVKHCGADATLLARIVRGLTFIDALDDVGVEVYAPNTVTRAFTTTKATSGLDLLQGRCIPCSKQQSRYLGLFSG